MLKRILSVLLVAAMAVSMMAGCGNDEGKKPANEGGKVTLELWHGSAEDTLESSYHQRYLKAANSFMANNEGYDVKIVGAVTAEKIMTALASGSGPDIVQPQWPFAGKWGAEGIIADLTDFVNNDPEFDKDDFIPSAWDRSTYKGRIYSIPTNFNSSELYYNVDYMNEFNAEVPKTINELKKLAVELTQYDDQGFITRCGYIPDYPWLDNVLWPVAFGAEWIDEETNTITFDTPEMKAAYQWQLDIYNEIGYDKLQTFKTSLGSGAQEPFMSGKTAMQFAGEWMFENIQNYAPDLNFDVAYCPYPDDKPELEGSMFCTIGAMMLNNNGKNSKEDGWKLLSWMAGKEVQADFAKGINNEGAMYSRKSALEASIINSDTVHPMKKQVAEMMMNPNVDGFPMSTYINEYLAIIADEMNKAFTDPAYTINMAAAAVQVEAQKLADASPVNE